jgi:spermidine/putrescine transport system ATP-binding protein
MVAAVIEPADGTPEIRLSGLSKHFREVRAVDEVSLDIRSGEFFSMLGPSGCGKTTTLRMIGGFELPTAGRIELRGRDVTTDPPDKRPVNMVFQNYALFPHLDVGENIAFGLRRKAVDKAEIKRRVAEALDLVHLPGYDRRKPNQLSGGQQQRVALARALVNRPNVLLLDEPLGALDLKLRKALQIELKRVQTEVGITFVYVTHDQEEALTMSDRIAVMNRGVIEQVGIPEVVYDSPTTTFVAGFIGVSNLMPGVAGPVSGGGTKLLLDSGVTVWASEDCGVKEGERCYAVVRPEKLQVSRVEDPAPSDRPSVEGMIESSLYLGTATQMVVRLHDDVTMTVLVPNASEAERQRLPGAGARVRLSWAPDHMHVVKESTTEPEPGVEET